MWVASGGGGGGGGGGLSYALYVALRRRTPTSRNRRSSTLKELTVFKNFRYASKIRPLRKQRRTFVLYYSPCVLVYDYDGRELLVGNERTLTFDSNAESERGRVVHAAGNDVVDQTDERKLLAKAFQFRISPARASQSPSGRSRSLALAAFFRSFPPTRRPLFAALRARKYEHIIGAACVPQSALFHSTPLHSTPPYSTPLFSSLFRILEDRPSPPLEQFRRACGATWRPSRRQVEVRGYRLRRDEKIERENEWKRIRYPVSGIRLRAPPRRLGRKELKSVAR
ncbi:hypothetical protein V9T40_007907 [Parthenolecanium corni]|uniref:Uncharacterized protein n=1 Tax=Parthenolecanium corni TaxID=536013 RepID=A0AAN9U1E5_9HEMI